MGEVGGTEPRDDWDIGGQGLNLGVTVQGIRIQAGLGKQGSRLELEVRVSGRRSGSKGL